MCENENKQKSAENDLWIVCTTASGVKGYSHTWKINHRYNLRDGQKKNFVPPGITIK